MSTLRFHCKSLTKIAMIGLACSWHSAAAFSADLSAGIGISSTPGLSVQYGDPLTNSIHASVSGHSTFFMGTVDHQAFVVPTFGNQDTYKFAFYSGLGLEGSVDRAAQRSEYRARIPIGIQAHLKNLRSNIFAEYVPRFGPLPLMNFRQQLAGGFRTYF